MKKIILVGLAIIATILNLHAQLPYGSTGLVDGAISVNVKTTTINTRDGHVESKSITTTNFSSKLLLQVFFSSLDDYKSSSNKESLKGIKIDQMLASVLSGDNYTKTLDSGQNPFMGIKPPMYDVTVSSNTESWELDPCGTEDISKRQLVKTGTCGASGPLKKGYCSVILLREGLAGDGFRLNIYTSNPVKEFGGGGPVGSGKSYGDDGTFSGKCKWYDVPCNGGVNTVYCADRVQSTEGWTRKSKAFYTKKEVFDNTVSTTDINYMTIDTTAFFAYLKNSKVPKIFNTSKGTYHKVTTKDGNPYEEYTEEATATFTVGLSKPKAVEISGVDDDAYHKFLPVPSTETGFKPLEVKAKIEINSNMKEDSLDFHLKDVTHYPGKAGNYPEKDKADYASDMFFAKQQPANIQYVDSFHVTTKGRVKEAIVYVWNSDYAAYASLEVRAVYQNVEGVSKYNERRRAGSGIP